MGLHSPRPSLFAFFTAALETVAALAGCERAVTPSTPPESVPTPTPTAAAIADLYSHQHELAKGKWAHSIDAWSCWQGPFTVPDAVTESWSRCDTDGHHFLREESSSVDEDGRTVPFCGTLITPDGMWDLDPVGKRAIRFPRADDHGVPPQGLSDAFFLPATWPLIAIGPAQFDGQARWVMVNDVPRPAARTYAQRFPSVTFDAPWQEIVTALGMTPADLFEPVRHRLYVDRECARVVAEELVSGGGVLIETHHYRSSTRPPTATTFTIPACYERLNPATMAEFDRLYLPKVAPPAATPAPSATSPATPAPPAAIGPMPTRNADF
jgi:hypothetical protein